MNNPLRGSRRPEVCHGIAFPLSILLWTMVFIFSSEGQIKRSDRITSIDRFIQNGWSSSLSAVCFPLIVPGASWLCGTRTAGSTLPLYAGAARPFSSTSVTNCNHHERSRAETPCRTGRWKCFGTTGSAIGRTISPFPRGAAPVLLYSNNDLPVRHQRSVPQAHAWLAGP